MNSGGRLEGEGRLGENNEEKKDGVPEEDLDEEVDGLAGLGAGVRVWARLVEDWDGLEAVAEKDLKALKWVEVNVFLLSWFILMMLVHEGEVKADNLNSSAVEACRNEGLTVNEEGRRNANMRGGLKWEIGSRLISREKKERIENSQKMRVL